MESGDRHGGANPLYLDHNDDDDDDDDGGGGNGDDHYIDDDDDDDDVIDRWQLSSMAWRYAISPQAGM